MARSTLFKNNQTQAVRLPKAVALPDEVKQVEITKLGPARLISPIDAHWDSFFDGPGVSQDFMEERAQPEQQEREDL